MSERDEPAVTTAEHLLGGDGEPGSLLDAVDGLLNRGVLLEGDLVLGLADVDLVYLRLSTLLAAADRVLRSGAQAPRAAAGGRAAPVPAAPHAPAPAAGNAPPAGARSDDADSASIDALRDQLEQTLGHARSGPAVPSPTPPPPAPPTPSASTPPAPAPAPADGTRAQRWNAAPEDVERSVARLVLALVDFLRQLMERQVIRRMEQGTLSDTEVERLGQALMRLEQTVHTMARSFNLDPEDLTLDLGPLGTLT